MTAPLLYGADGQVIAVAGNAKPRIAQADEMPFTRTGLHVSIKQQFNALVRRDMDDALNHKPSHALAVARGQSDFRRDFLRAYAGHLGKDAGRCHDLANKVWHFMGEQWTARYPEETASAFLDRVHIPIPQTEKELEAEIEGAWELEIASSEASMRDHYEGSARTRKGADLGLKGVR